MSTKVLPIVVTLDDEGMSRITHIKAQLEAEGMHVSRVMPKLGVIAGTASNLAKLKSIDGVESVSIDHDQPLPPKGSTLQ